MIKYYPVEKIEHDHSYGVEITFDQIKKIRNYIEERVSGGQTTFNNYLGNSLEYIRMPTPEDIVRGTKRNKRSVPRVVRLKTINCVEKNLQKRESNLLIEAMCSVGINTPYNRKQDVLVNFLK